MNSNIVSFQEKKMKKEIQTQKKLFETIFDFYIPYKEISFWSKVCDFCSTLKITYFTDSGKNAEAKEFINTFSVDIEMYQDFGTTLEKFRFLFSYFELFVLHKVLSDMKDSKESESELMQHYLSFLSQVLLENKPLYRLVEQNSKG